MSDSELHLDVSTDARRQAIFGSLVQQIANEDRPRVARIIDDMSIPAAAHLQDLAEVERAIDSSVATDVAKEHARAVYRILAEAEGEVHGCPVEETHFHEVGLGMTCREIIAICTCVEVIAPARIFVSAVQTGSGTVECSHGTLDIPAPATAAILQKYSIPTCDDVLEGELCTPTSAAIIAHFADEFE